jgi:phage host-nuclease inhibitor protein Gam
VKIHELIEQYRERLQVLKAKREAIRATIESFCLERKEEFIKKRSRQFTFGKVAWRLSEEVEIPKGLEKAVLAAIRKLGMDECIRVKEEIDKNALRKLPDNVLLKLGVQKRKRDNFRIEPNLEMIAEKVGVAMPTIWADVEKVSRVIRKR